MASGSDIKMILFESLEGLLKTHDMEKVTVHKILENCGVSRSTFYRNFRDKYDLMVWAYGNEFEKIISKSPGIASYREVVYETGSFLQAKRRYFSDIADVNVQNSFFKFMYENGLKYNLQCIKEFLNCKELPVEYVLSAQAKCAGNIFITFEWIKRGCDIPNSKLTEIICNSVPYNLFWIFKQEKI